MYKVEHFTDTIYYQIELTAKYCKNLGVQMFSKSNIEITLDEFCALDVIMLHDGICQRELAKLILKDRANTGKLLDSLEAKGLIDRELAIKNNRPVKIVKITEEGKRIYKATYAKLEPHHKFVEEKIKNTDLAKMGTLLKELREILEDTIDIDI
jgi:DNA-binding MarR family transcriptional regulator